MLACLEVSLGCNMIPYLPWSLHRQALTPGRAEPASALCPPTEPTFSTFSARSRCSPAGSCPQPARQCHLPRLHALLEGSTPLPRRETRAGFKSWFCHAPILGGVPASPPSLAVPVCEVRRNEVEDSWLEGCVKCAKCACRTKGRGRCHCSAPF